MLRKPGIIINSSNPLSSTFTRRGPLPPPPPNPLYVPPPGPYFPPPRLYSPRRSYSPDIKLIMPINRTTAIILAIIVFFVIIIAVIIIVTKSRMKVNPTT